VSASMVMIKADRLRGLVGDIFSAAGCSRGEAERIAHYLVAANLAGHDSHGVVRVPRYVEMKRDGRVVADQTIEVTVDTPVLAVIDGRFGFGQSVAPQAVEIGIAKCKAMGLSAVSLRNSGHIGRVGDWAEMAAAADLISIHFVNAGGSVLVAPFGGVERRFSTAPYCIGVPMAGRPPLVLDFATSVVAEGKVLVASQGGKKIPPDALIGPDGAMSGDPAMLYGEHTPTGSRDFRKGSGAIRAFGDHKGSGLALMCEVLGGALTGNGCASLERPSANGMFSLYVDPARIDPAGFFPEEASRYVDHVKRAKPAQPGGEILVPGEPEQKSRERRLAEGIPLPDDTWTSIKATARSVGLAEPTS
jgi:hydroxycarboxylate dehydrogenase B